MTSSAINDLNFSLYQDMVDSMFKQQVQLRFSRNDTVIWPDSAGADTALSNYERIASHPIENIQGIELAQAELYCNADTRKTIESNSDVNGILHKLCGLIQQELLAQTELTAMTTEMIERNAELNLVYMADQIVGQEGNVIHQLNALVEGCLLNMNVEYVHLYMPDLRENCHAGTAPEGSPNGLASSGVEALLNSLLLHFQSETDQLVINTGEEAAKNNLPFIGKMIAAPVLVGGKDCLGVLLLMNSQECDVFKNSDRNLAISFNHRVSMLLGDSYDPTTACLNRLSFDSFLTEFLLTVDTQPEPASLLAIDLDDFHVINDAYGFDAGDQALRATAQILYQLSPKESQVARTGSNEFFVFLPNTAPAAAVVIATRIVKQIKDFNFGLEGLHHELTCSIGIVPLDKEIKYAESAITNALMACREAKTLGKNRVFSILDSSKETAQRKSYVASLERVINALANDGFTMFAQPILAAQLDDGVLHFEILIRMLDDDLSIISPAEFLPAAEKYRLMYQLDCYVINATCLMLGEFRKANPDLELNCSMNMSGQSISLGSMQTFLLNCLKKYDVPPEWIVIEITETSAVENLEKAREVMLGLRNHGIQFSLDDFGTGLSSYAYIKDFQMDYLKIDGAFVRNLSKDGIDQAIVRSITEVSRELGLLTVAEHVGDQASVKILKDFGVNYLQGYMLGVPIPLKQLLDEHAALHAR